jgi:hypothetical protein
LTDKEIYFLIVHFLLCWRWPVEDTVRPTGLECFDKKGEPLEAAALPTPMKQGSTSKSEVQKHF